MLALAMAAVATATLAAPEADALIESLARPAPASIAFAEARFSPLLKEPLIVSGELDYAGPTSLDRHVTQPYREDTAIRGESVRVEREGEPARSFGLRRAPELRGLLNSFTALLAGDAAAVRRSFDVSITGEEDDWTLELTPKDTKARRRVKQIVVSGAANEPHCFSMLNADGGASVMLLGSMAEIDIAATITLEALRQQCGSGIGNRESGIESEAEPQVWRSEPAPDKENTNSSAVPSPESRIPDPESGPNPASGPSPAPRAPRPVS